MSLPNESLELIAEKLLWRIVDKHQDYGMFKIGSDYKYTPVDGKRFPQWERDHELVGIYDRRTCMRDIIEDLQFMEEAA